MSAARAGTCVYRECNQGIGRSPPANYGQILATRTACGDLGSSRQLGMKLIF
jgi:hypothetical protein